MEQPPDPFSKKKSQPSGVKFVQNMMKHTSTSTSHKGVPESIKQKDR